MDRASSGRVLIGGKDVTRLAPSQRDGSMVFQSYALFPHLNVIDNVAYGLQAGGMRKTESHAQARDELALVGLAVSDRVIVMSNARIAQIGLPRELYERPVDRFLADFIGDANLIAGVVVQDGAAQWFVAGTLRPPLHGGHVNGPALFAVRPQRLSLHRSQPSTPFIRGKLRKTAYLGTHLEHNVDTEFGDMLIIDADVDRDLLPNEAVHISLDARSGAVVPA